MANFSGGRPRDSYVWKHFKYVESDQKSICIMVKSDATECGQPLKASLLQTLKYILKVSCNGVQYIGKG